MIEVFAKKSLSLSSGVNKQETYETRNTRTSFLCHRKNTESHNFHNRDGRFDCVLIYRHKFIHF